MAYTGLQFIKKEQGSKIHFHLADKPDVVIKDNFFQAQYMEAGREKVTDAEIEAEIDNRKKSLEEYWRS